MLKAKRGDFIKINVSERAKKWLVIGVNKPLPFFKNSGIIEVIIQDKKGQLKRITIEDVKEICK
ncbi:MAG: hypothetical protein A2513_04420 [Sulfurimonas sp. RIFOXYD12_FULL_33_39]|uniref:hypothetical protein n=1 Tax=unclassified Sulfurimonas TaxID=2623549 RepID=UPI0008ADD99C|nr:MULTISPECIES: hypothetical protein [unclassified Sulfurimonas]OHE09379.1 MAG: hypothetical protein A2513_04420 [Sulfurimonas sp. RIFOXYD12_FULL_33_39]OHE12839.1 MAG: hypothetical protein A2530_04385 [Sulfurimonas sp. RIFOXYD2_FULL_34_21]DAB27342.1 MAG TPA: hypothetical protein CFH78_08430 [Sulfurimonas sp. UBA10385]